MKTNKKTIFKDAPFCTVCVLTILLALFLFGDSILEYIKMPFIALAALLS